MNKILAVAFSAMLAFAVVGCNNGSKSVVNTPDGETGNPPGDVMPPEIEFVYVDKLGDDFDGALETWLKEVFEPLLIERGLYHEKGYVVRKEEIAYSPRENIYRISILDGIDETKLLAGWIGNSELDIDIAIDDDGNLYNIIVHLYPDTEPPYGSLTYVGTTGGECSKNALSKSRSSQESPVDIITTADSIRVRTEISFYCATPFTTECTINGKTVSMKIKDARENLDYVAGCDCNYPFEFQFARTGDVDYNYIIEFVPQGGELRIVAEGKL